MPSESALVPLSDVVLLQRGFDLPEYAREPGEVPVVASNGVIGRHVEAKAAAPGVVIGRSGSIGGGQYLSVPFWPLNTTLWVKDFRDNHPRFVYYLLRSIDFTRLNAGSGVPTLNRNHLKGTLVWLPAPDEQQRIATVLGALDDKIDSNQRLAQTLDDAAATMFRAWFVEFIGVKELIGSEIGNIPKGWSVKRIDQLAAVNEISLTAKRHPTQISYVDISSVGTRSIRQVQDLAFDVAPSRARRVVRPGDTIISTVRPERRSLAFVHDAQPNLIASTGFAVVSPTVGTPTFVYRAVTSDACIEHLAVTATGSAYPAANPREIAGWRVAVPPDYGASFEKFSRPLEAARHSIDRESTTLRELRDALLPKLISGQVRVRDDADPGEMPGSAPGTIAARTL